jgi:hypothetical protein
LVLFEEILNPAGVQDLSSYLQDAFGVAISGNRFDKNKYIKGSGVAGVLCVEIFP